MTEMASLLVVVEGTFDLGLRDSEEYLRNMSTVPYMKNWTIALFGILLIAASPIRGFSVLCISELGHLEIEVVGSSCCKQEATPTMPNASFVAEPTDECGSCVDVLFAHEVTAVSLNNLATRPADRLFGPLSNAFAQSAVSPCDYCTHSALAQRDFPIAPLLHSQFSAVMRC